MRWHLGCPGAIPPQCADVLKGRWTLLSSARGREGLCVNSENVRGLVDGHVDVVLGDALPGPAVDDEVDLLAEVDGGRGSPLT